jgi:hypothetical protein
MIPISKPIKNINSLKQKTTIKMRNFSEATVASTKVFTASYGVALAWARSEQAGAPDNVSYTIDGDEGGEGVVTKHEGFNGGQPVYQPIVHSKEPISLSSVA